MKQGVFHEKWEKGLTEYLRKIDATRIFGFDQHHRNGEPAKHGYIIDLRDGETKNDVIKKFNVLFGQEDFEKLIGKPHRFARHLNSSQVMCYNFFRPKMTVIDSKSRWCYANNEMVKFVKETIGIKISEKSRCQFEYEDFETKKAFKEYSKYKGRGENSQYDFLIQDGETKIYFEIKYTESSFGRWSDRNVSGHSIKNHCAYIERGYKGMVDKSPFLTQESKDAIRTFDEEEFASPSNPFNLQYQLFRNALKADQLTYTVFIYPKANPGPLKEFEAFKRNLVDGQNHIIALQWEDLTSYMLPEFIEKYIKILE